jgi:hypothetical protein
LKGTAIARKFPSLPLTEILHRFPIPREGKRILDLGCGYGADGRWLKGLGYTVHMYDIADPKTVKPQEGEVFDVVYAGYVLCVIPMLKQRLSFLREAVGYLHRFGTAFIVIRLDKAKGQPFHTFLPEGPEVEGVLTSRGYQRNYTLNSFTEELEKSGLPYSIEYVWRGRFAIASLTK